MSGDTSSIVTMFLLSTLGFSIFVYGRKQRRAPHLVAGVALMTYPFFFSGVLVPLAIGAGIVGACWLAVRAGW